MRKIAFIFTTLVIFASSPRVEAFSEGFKKYMTSVQEKAMLKGKKFGMTDAKLSWDKFDEEIISILSKTETKTPEVLNQETKWTELSTTVRKGTERDEIELGAIEAKFFNPVGGKSWIVSLYNGMGALPTSTFHVYKNGDGGWQRIASFEDVIGPWDTEKLIFSTIQLQEIHAKPGMKFTSFHLPPIQKSKSNRSQIVWNMENDCLKPVYWVPEVDWHTVGDKQAEGRGDAFPVSP